mmetsp:Transcript_156978/g.273310  ORF Transcript_156978/g.273310 Transcript_156978/m.273310 type:complete len:210 (+) Transcript_156978:892-1521(+)
MRVHGTSFVALNSLHSPANVSPVWPRRRCHSLCCLRGFVLAGLAKWCRLRGRPLGVWRLAAAHLLRANIITARHLFLEDPFLMSSAEVLCERVVHRSIAATLMWACSGLRGLWTQCWRSRIFRLECAACAWLAVKLLIDMVFTFCINSRRGVLLTRHALASGHLLLGHCRRACGFDFLFLCFCIRSLLSLCGLRMSSFLGSHITSFAAP